MLICLLACTLLRPAHMLGCEYFFSQSGAAMLKCFSLTCLHAHVILHKHSYMLICLHARNAYMLRFEMLIFFAPPRNSVLDVSWLIFLGNESRSSPRSSTIGAGPGGRKTYRKIFEVYVRIRWYAYILIHVSACMRTGLLVYMLPRWHTYTRSWLSLAC